MEKIQVTCEMEVTLKMIGGKCKPLILERLIEKGLAYVAEGTITPAEYMEKLERFVTLRTNGVRQAGNQYLLRPYFDAAAQFYKK